MVKLKELYLEGNDLNWVEQEYYRDIKVLSRLTDLVMLTLQGNPFVAGPLKGEYRQAALRELMKGKGKAKFSDFRQLTNDFTEEGGGKQYTIDGEIVQMALLEQAYNLTDVGAVDGADEVLGPEDVQLADQDTLHPTLELIDINTRLELCLEKPATTLKAVREISNAIRATVFGAKEATLVSGLLARKPELIRAMVDSILQSMLLLCDRQPEVRKPIIEIIAIGMAFADNQLGAKCAREFVNAYHAHIVPDMHNFCSDVLLRVGIGTLCSGKLDSRMRNALLRGITLVVEEVPTLCNVVSRALLSAGTKASKSYVGRYASCQLTQWMVGLTKKSRSGGAASSAASADTLDPEFVQTTMKLIAVLSRDRRTASAILSPLRWHDNVPTILIAVEKQLDIVGCFRVSSSGAAPIDTLDPVSHPVIFDLLEIATNFIRADHRTHEQSLVPRARVKACRTLQSGPAAIAYEDFVSTTARFAEAGLHHQLLVFLKMMMTQLDKVRRTEAIARLMASIVNCIAAFVFCGDTTFDAESEYVRSVTSLAKGVKKPALLRPNRASITVGGKKSPALALLSAEIMTVQLCTLVTQEDPLHPLAVTACFDVLFQLLQQFSDLDSASAAIQSRGSKYEQQARISQALQPIGLLQFLGTRLAGRKYEKLCELAADTGAFNKGHPRPLRDLTSAVMHRMLLSVLRLVGFYCAEASNDSQNTEAVFIAAAMNNNSRETILFDCLDVPCDDVAIAAVQSLKAVDANDFDSREIASLIQRLRGYMNVGVGQTELIVSGLFGLLTRLILSRRMSDSMGGALRENIDNQTNEAVNIALKILKQNLNRDTSDDKDEDDEKVLLSAAVVDFLVAVTAVPKLVQSLVVESRVLTKILQIEDKHSWAYSPAAYLEPQSSASLIYRPSLIELTWLGNDVLEMVLALVGGSRNIADEARNPLRSDGVVAGRCLRRIADLLEGGATASLEVKHCAACGKMLPIGRFTGTQRLLQVGRCACCVGDVGGDGNTMHWTLCSTQTDVLRAVAKQWMFDKKHMSLRQKKNTLDAAGDISINAYQLPDGPIRERMIAEAIQHASVGGRPDGRRHDLARNLTIFGVADSVDVTFEMHVQMRTLRLRSWCKATEELSRHMFSGIEPLRWGKFFVESPALRTLFDRQVRTSV